MTTSRIAYRTSARFTLPAAHRARAVKSDLNAKYPFASMTVGATLIFQTRNHDQRQTIRGYLSYIVAAKALRFTTRTLDDGRLAIQRLPDNTPKRAYHRKRRARTLSRARVNSPFTPMPA